MNIDLNQLLRLFALFLRAMLSGSSNINDSFIYNLLTSLVGGALKEIVLPRQVI